MMTPRPYERSSSVTYSRNCSVNMAVACGARRGRWTTCVKCAPSGTVMLGTSPNSPYTIGLLGHSMSVWDNVVVLGVFGVAMALLAMWSLNNQE